MGGGGKYNEYWVNVWLCDKIEDLFEYIIWNSNDCNCKE